MSARILKTLQPCEEGRRIFCGAGALMTLTGKTHIQAIRTINRANSKQPLSKVTSLYPNELLPALKRVGLKFKRAYTFSYSNDRPTLKQWVNQRQAKEKGQTFLIQLTSHWIVISGNMFNDNHTKAPVKIDDAPHLTKRVVYVWRVKS